MWWSAWSRNQTDSPVAGSWRRCSHARQSDFQAGDGLGVFPPLRAPHAIVTEDGAAVHREQPLRHPFGEGQVVEPGRVGQVGELPLGGLEREPLDLLGVEQPARAAVERLAGHRGDVLLEHAAHGLLDQRPGAGQRVRAGAVQAWVVHGAS